MRHRAPQDAEPGVFVHIRPGVAVAVGGVDAVLADLGRLGPNAYLLEEGAPDLRDIVAPPSDVVVFVGDHHGFDVTTQEHLVAHGIIPIGVGPVSIHADDAITLVCNELDRRSLQTELEVP